MKAELMSLQQALVELQDEKPGIIMTGVDPLIRDYTGTIETLVNSFMEKLWAIAKQSGTTEEQIAQLLGGNNFIWGISPGDRAFIFLISPDPKPGPGPRLIPWRSEEIVMPVLVEI